MYFSSNKLDFMIGTWPRDYHGELIVSAVKHGGGSKYCTAPRDLAEEEYSGKIRIQKTTVPKPYKN